MHNLQGETICVLKRGPKVEIRKTCPTGKSCKACQVNLMLLLPGSLQTMPKKKTKTIKNKNNNNNASVQIDLTWPNTEDKFKALEIEKAQRQAIIKTSLKQASKMKQVSLDLSNPTGGQSAKRQNLNVSSENVEVYKKPFYMQKLQGALRTVNDTSAGPDEIHYQLLKHLQKSYRPFLLTSCSCKTMARMINRRLVWYLESHNLLINVHCGFRSRRSTIHHLVRFETFSSLINI